jgi:DNA repair photolyase
MFSIPTIDRQIWNATEPGTAPPRQRLRALTRLVDAGIDAGVGMAPILPGLSDRPELLADVVRAARDAGATSIWAGLLNLRPGTREHFLENLARYWTELMPRYQRLYAGRAYLGRDEVEPVRREVAELRERFAIGDRRRVRILPIAPPPPPGEQLELSLPDRRPAELRRRARAG